MQVSNAIARLSNINIRYKHHLSKIWKPKEHMEASCRQISYIHGRPRYRRGIFFLASSEERRRERTSTPIQANSAVSVAKGGTNMFLT